MTVREMTKKKIKIVEQACLLLKDYHKRGEEFAQRREDLLKLVSNFMHSLSSIKGPVKFEKIRHSTPLFHAEHQLSCLLSELKEWRENNQSNSMSSSSEERKEEPPRPSSRIKKGRQGEVAR